MSPRDRLKQIILKDKAKRDRTVTWTWGQSYQAGAFARRLGVWQMHDYVDPCVDRDAWVLGWDDVDRIIDECNGVPE